MAVSNTTIKRLPVYLQYLKQLPADTENISATAIANGLRRGAVQVRKDLSGVSGEGRPRVGYNVESLIASLEKALGYNEKSTAVLVGAGKLGGALLGYKGFEEYGLHIVAAFDMNPEKAGTEEGGKPIYAMEDFQRFCKRRKIKIGIITTGAGAAQSVCDLMVESGIKAIWNFAPVHLDSHGVPLRSENMAASLAMLLNQLN